MVENESHRDDPHLAIMSGFDVAQESVIPTEEDVQQAIEDRPVIFEGRVSDGLCLWYDVDSDGLQVAKPFPQTPPSNNHAPTILNLSQAPSCDHGDAKLYSIAGPSVCCVDSSDDLH